jgi:hypothetical protein
MLPKFRIAGIAPLLGSLFQLSARRSSTPPRHPSLDGVFCTPANFRYLLRGNEVMQQHHTIAIKVRFKLFCLFSVHKHLLILSSGV